MPGARTLRVHGDPDRSKGTTAARPLRPSCSSSTLTATPASSASAQRRLRSRNRPISPSRTVASSPSKSSTNEGGTMTARRPPVKDWATDFDHLDPRWINDPFPIWEEMRQSARSPIPTGSSASTSHRYEDVRAVAYDTEHFSSRRVVVRETRRPTNDPRRRRSPPTRRTTGWPSRCCCRHSRPTTSTRLEPQAAAICNELIDKFIAAGSCDAAVEHTRAHPGHGDRAHAGRARERRRSVPSGSTRSSSSASPTTPTLMQALQEMTQYFARPDRKRRKNAGVRSHLHLMQRAPDGEPLTDDARAGLAAAAADRRHRHDLERDRRPSLWHLAKTPADRRRLVAEPELMPVAIEELLRAYAPVTMAREVVKDTEINGCPIKAGNMVLLSFPAANRDPAMFPDADKVDHRPQGEPSRRLRPRHPPLRRLQPGAHGDDGGGGGVPEAHPGVQPRRPRRPGRKARCAARASCRSDSDVVLRWAREMGE